MILVAGAVANKPHSGGEAWVRMSWVRGLRRLGLDVAFVEQIDSATCVDENGQAAPFERSVNRATFAAAVAALAPDCPAALVCDGGAAVAGMALDELTELARGADLLVNISGHLTLEPLRSAPRRRAYVDLDPGFTQIWAEQGADLGLAGHDTHFTVGENIGSQGCPIPTAGFDWRPLPPPVTLADWPVTSPPAAGRFTTIATWRSPLGTLSHRGTTFSGKHHQWRRIADLPARAPGREFEIALDIHPGDQRDRDALAAAGWRLADPRAVAGDPPAFRDYVRGSGAELSVAHGAYVETRSGWVSDRTVRYLAAGRPALVQDTGIAARYPVGEGLVTFRTAAEAAAGAERIARDHAAHAEAARALAEAHFDSDRVLPRFLEQAGVS